jgi:hypothetical protein
MKRLVLAAVLLILLAGGYYFRGFFLETQDLNIHLYTLYSGNPDELYRFEPVVEAQMRRLPILQDVNSDLQVEISETIDLDLKAEGCDRLRDDRTKFSACVARAKVMLPGITISFKLAPGGSARPSHRPNPGHGKAAGTIGRDHDEFLQATGPISDPANDEVISASSRVSVHVAGNEPVSYGAGSGISMGEPL